MFGQTYRRAMPLERGDIIDSAGFRWVAVHSAAPKPSPEMKCIIIGPPLSSWGDIAIGDPTIPQITEPVKEKT